MEKKMIIIRGLPGSGKTTLADLIGYGMSEEYTVESFAADDYFYVQRGFDCSYEFDASKLHLAHQDCQMRLEGYLAEVDFMSERGKVAIVHNTSTTEKELKPYLDLAEKYGFEVTSLIVENRHGNKSVHGVPDEAMDRMKARFVVQL